MVYDLVKLLGDDCKQAIFRFLHMSNTNRSGTHVQGHLRSFRNFVGPLYRCCVCPSEYQVEMKRTQTTESRSAIYELIVNRWLDLGSDTTSKNTFLVALTSDWNYQDSCGYPFDVEPFGDIKHRFNKQSGTMEEGREPIIPLKDGTEKFNRLQIRGEWCLDPVPLNFC